MVGTALPLWHLVLFACFVPRVSRAFMLRLLSRTLFSYSVESTTDERIGRSVVPLPCGRRLVLFPLVHDFLPGTVRWLRPALMPP